MTNEELYKVYYPKINQILCRWSNKPSNYADIWEDVKQEVMYKVLQIPNGTKRNNWPYVKRVIITNISKSINKINKTNNGEPLGIVEWNDSQKLYASQEEFDYCEFKLNYESLWNSLTLDEQIILNIFINNNYKNNRSINYIMSKEIFKTTEETKLIWEGALKKVKDHLRNEKKKI